MMCARPRPASFVVSPKRPMKTVLISSMTTSKNRANVRGAARETMFFIILVVVRIGRL